MAVGLLDDIGYLQDNEVTVDDGNDFEKTGL